MLESSRLYGRLLGVGAFYHSGGIRLSYHMKSFMRDSEKLINNYYSYPDGSKKWQNPPLPTLLKSAFFPNTKSTALLLHIKRTQELLDDHCARSWFD